MPPASPRPTGRKPKPVGAESGWSAGRSHSRPEDKLRMARYFTRHDFLVRDGDDPESVPRLTSASILVNPGTTPNAVVQESVHWMAENWAGGPFYVNWYTTGMLVPATLRDFRDANFDYRSAASLFLFPGYVDPDTESVSGTHAVEYVSGFATRFAYAILSAYALDLATGHTYFHFHAEVPLQTACAKLYANHKFLFFDPTKLDTIEGVRGYNLRDLLETSQAVTIYTVEGPGYPAVRRRFDQFCEATLAPRPRPARGRAAGPDGGSDAVKMLRLCCVRENGEPLEDRQVRGTLRPGG